MTVITTSQLAEALDISQRMIRKRASKELWIIQTRVKIGGNTYDLDTISLSKEERHKVRAYLATCAIPTLPVPTYPTEAEPPHLACIDTFPLKQQPARPLPEQKKRLALAKFELVRLYLIHLQKAGRKRKTHARDEFIILYQAGQWPELRELLGEVSWKTIESWKLKIKGNGDPFSLADTRGGHQRGMTKVTQEQAEIMRNLAYQPNKIRISSVVRWAQMAMRNRGIDSLSDTTCRRFIERLRDADYPLWTFQREGEQALENKCGYTIERDWDLIEVGDLVTADGHVLNFEVINPGTGKPCRPTLILWYDCKSNMPLGWELMPTENTAAIHSALRRAILFLGKVPRVAYLDNGRAFKGKHFTGAKDFDNGQITGLYARLGIATTFAWPYHGQSKTVERFFGTLLEMESILPTYTGNSITNKPARLHRGERLHRKLWDRFGGNVSLTIDQAHSILAAWFDEYATRPQRGHLKGKSPKEVFDAGRGPGVDQEQLAELMMSVELRSISKQGVRMFGLFYYHPALYGRREPVVVRYDIQNQESLYLYEKNGAFICQAERKIAVHPAARVLGDDRDKSNLSHELETKHRIKSMTVGTARELLKTVVLPEHKRQMEAMGFTVGTEQRAEIEEKVVPLDREAFAREVEESTRLHHEAEAKVLEESLLRLNESDRYERLIELEAMGERLSLEWAEFMTMFEQTTAYTDYPEYWETCRMKYCLFHRASAAQRQPGN